ncbi:MAG: hypothetical protein Kow0069_12510 [Promethearchaeota archaeon]
MQVAGNQAQLGELVRQLIEAEPAVFAAAVLSGNNVVIYQTSNWDVTAEAYKLAAVQSGQEGAVELQGVRYAIVERVPERIVGTNVAGQGHVILCPAGTGWLLVYVNPQVGPRDALFSVQEFAAKMAPYV